MRRYVIKHGWVYGEFIVVDTQQYDCYSQSYTYDDARVTCEWLNEREARS